jgi:hypothetical protein
MRGFFSSIYCEKLVEFLEETLTGVGGRALQLNIPDDVLTHRLVHHKPSATD